MEEYTHIYVVTISMERTSGEELETRPSEAVDYQHLIGAPREIAQFILNPNGEIFEWPPGAQAVYGFDENEVLGQSLE